MFQLEFNARMLKSLLSPLFYISQWHCKSKLPSLILRPFTSLSTVETCINSNQKEQASSNPCRSSGLFLEMFWLRNTRWSHCLSEASLRLSCMLLAGRLSHRTTERRSRCVEAFLCRLRTIHESLRLCCVDAFLCKLQTIHETLRSNINNNFQNSSLNFNVSRETFCGTIIVKVL